MIYFYFTFYQTLNIKQIQIQTPQFRINQKLENYLSPKIKNMDRNQLKLEDQLYDDSMNFDDNYNQQEFLQNTSSESNKKQKFTIMSDFNQICTKLNIATEDSNKTQTQSANNFLAQYYTKLKQQTQKDHLPNQPPTYNPNTCCPNQSLSANSHYRSSSQTIKPILQEPHHQHTPSYKVQQQNRIIPLIQSKRNHYSVQDRKNILQPTKIQTQVYVPLKDYFGDDSSFVNRKVHGKMFINNIKPKVFKNQREDIQPNEENKQHHFNHNDLNKLKHQNHHNDLSKLKHQNIKNDLNKLKHQNNKNDLSKLKHQNNLKDQNNLKQANLTMQKTTNHNDQHNFQKPKIIIYKKVIDLTQSTQSIIQAFRKEQMISDYEISNLNQSRIEQGLFAKAIVHQRASKTGQNVYSSNYSTSEAVLKEQIMQQKQPILSPINSNYPNSPNPAYQSIIQKRQSYLR